MTAASSSCPAASLTSSGSSSGCRAARRSTAGTWTSSRRWARPVASTWRRTAFGSLPPSGCVPVTRAVLSQNRRRFGDARHPRGVGSDPAAPSASGSRAHSVPAVDVPASLPRRRSEPRSLGQWPVQEPSPDPCLLPRGGDWPSGTSQSRPQLGFGFWSWCCQRLNALSSDFSSVAQSCPTL